MSNLDCDCNLGTLAYTTVKLVLIQDYKLALIHWLFMTIISAYIITSTVSDQSYLEYETPVGNVRLDFQRPDTLREDYPSLTYCNDIGTIDPATNPLFCEVWDAETLAPITDLSNSFFVATYVLYEEQVRNCSSIPVIDNFFGVKNCLQPFKTISSLETYTAAPEFFNILVEHSSYSPTFDRKAPDDWDYFRGQSQQMDGILHRRDEEPVTLPGGEADQFTIQDLLELVGNTEELIDLDSLCIDTLCNNSETFRKTGVQLFVNIDYTNTWSLLAPKRLRYEIYVDRVLDASFQVQTVVFRSQVGSQVRRVVKTVSGVRMDFLQAGNVGRFDISVLMISGVSAIGLLAVSTTITDFITLYMLHEKEQYHNMKYYFPGQGKGSQKMDVIPEPQTTSVQSTRARGRSKRESRLNFSSM